ncbi:MAG: hypothetical protein HKP61_15915 [Dactylosporangium sp.]|nr:hypothetical protein [Dactylosporangium sp.]NNJ62392.1 hypothetical protein [Dactylosporangium sp.]
MTAPAQHNRGRAIAALVVVAVVFAALMCGLGYFIAVLMRDAGTSGGGPGAPTSASAAGTASPAIGEDPSLQAQQDALADEPMLQLPMSAAQPQPLVAETAGPPIVVPAPTGRVVPDGPPVATGFPHTPEGALAQLAAIDEGAFGTTDLHRVHEVYAWAALPGAVPEDQWSPTGGVTTLIDHLGGRSKALQAQVVFQAVQGQLKGTIGQDFVVACVLGQMDVTAASTARAGVGDCQRMVWRDGRWWIGPGAQPAAAPSAWPGSADAVRAGWRELRRG